MKSKSKASGIERRRYKRLDHIFPVEFQCLNASRQMVSGWYQAFTQDISDGGLCLTVNHIGEQDIKLLADAQTHMILRIHIPLASKGTRASARLVWFKKLKGDPSFAQYVLGVAYEEIEPKSRRQIMRYIRTRHLLKIAAVVFTAMLALALVSEGFHNMRLRWENEKLLSRLSENLTQQRTLATRHASLESQIEDMRFSLSQASRKLEVLEQQLTNANSNDQKVIAELKQSIDFFRKREAGMRRNLSDLEAHKVKAEAEALDNTKERSLLEGEILNKLYHWLAMHQHNATGLVASYEGDSDLKDWGFTYDEALAAITFVKLGDAAKAQKIFDFYLKAPKTDSGCFANAYDVSTGEVVEYATHAGPNIWLGLAILQYTSATQDTQYLKIAQEIGLWLNGIKDADGGLKGGKEFSWYSTEHNLDAFAFYRMMAQLTKDTAYDAQAQTTLAWLNKNAYSKLSNPIVKRGKGDATIATDTYAWSLTALGPELLKSIGMDPDGIMDFAINQCGVCVTYQKSDGATVKVKGFDFAKAQNVGRGGVVSCEWSAQMVLALKIMASYHEQLGDTAKANTYARLAQEYISELSKMTITSLSPVGQGDFCLPYASQGMADTGHGWRTPQGNRTGSVAATAYAILAIKGYNPLVLEENGKETFRNL